MLQLAASDYIKRTFLTVEHSYPDFKIRLHSLICQCANPNLTLTEHIDFKWMDRDQLAVLDWAEADIPIVDRIVYGEEMISSYYSLKTKSVNVTV